MSDVRDSISVVRPAEPVVFRILWGAVILFVVAGFVGFILHMGKSKAKGDATLSTGTKSWTMHVNACTSGERRQFFGVTFFDENQPQSGGRLILPVDREASLGMNRPDKNYSVVFKRSDCSLWDVTVDHTNSTYNGIWAVEGHARFDCTVPDTDTTLHATGDLQFDSCH